jgi:hypothetical protein
MRSSAPVTVSTCRPSPLISCDDQSRSRSVALASSWPLPLMRSLRSVPMNGWLLLARAWAAVTTWASRRVSSWRIAASAADRLRR